MITISDINTIVNEALYMVIKMSLPILLTSMIIGLVISIFQTVTSIQEQTLTFVPKVIGVFAMIMLIGNWMLTELSGFIVTIWSDFSKYVRQEPDIARVRILNEAGIFAFEKQVSLMKINKKYT